MTEHIPTELELAEEALKQARRNGDMAGVNKANQRIQEIRARIAKTRTHLTQMAGERIHLIEMVDQARIQLRRYERNLDDHNRMMDELRKEIRRLGGSSFSLNYTLTPDDSPPE